MEFHGTCGAPISLTWAVPSNSMELGVRQFRWHEQFHGIPWNSMELGMRQFRRHEQFHGIPWNSVELGVRQFRRHEQLHGIPWNLECANFDDTSSSMKFHAIPWNLECANVDDTSSSMEFHGTMSAPISLTWAVPWNSMELRMRQFRWHEQFRNSMKLEMRQFRWHEKFHIISPGEGNMSGNQTLSWFVRKRNMREDFLLQYTCSFGRITVR